MWRHAAFKTKSDRIVLIEARRFFACLASSISSLALSVGKSWLDKIRATSSFAVLEGLRDNLLLRLWQRVQNSLHSSQKISFFIARRD